MNSLLKTRPEKTNRRHSNLPSTLSRPWTRWEARRHCEPCAPRHQRAHRKGPSSCVDNQGSRAHPAVTRPFQAPNPRASARHLSRGDRRPLSRQLEAAEGSQALIYGWWVAFVIFQSSTRRPNSAGEISPPLPPPGNCLTASLQSIFPSLIAADKASASDCSPSGEMRWADGVVQDPRAGAWRKERHWCRGV